MTIKTNKTKKEICREIVELIRDAHTGNSMSQTIGIDTDGDVDYWHNVNGLEGCAVPVYNSEEWNLGDLDYDDPDAWTEEVIDGLSEAFEREWLDDSIRESGVEVAFSKTKTLGEVIEIKCLDPQWGNEDNKEWFGKNIDNAELTEEFTNDGVDICVFVDLEGEKIFLIDSDYHSEVLNEDDWSKSEFNA
jgi:hypothetical protein